MASENRAEDQPEAGDAGCGGCGRRGMVEPACAVCRRSVVTGGLASVAAVGIFGQMGASAAAASAPERLLAQPGDHLQLIKGANNGDRLRPDMLQPGDKPAEAFPLDPASGTLRRRNRLNRVLALRLDTADMDETTSAGSVDGVVVYSALCTHRACTIKLWMAEQKKLHCQCHSSVFAALAAGRVDAGPARRPLPMLPVSVDGSGFITVRDGFTRKPGRARK